MSSCAEPETTEAFLSHPSSDGDSGLHDKPTGSETKCHFCIPVRYQISVLLAVAIALSNATIAGFSMALISMVNSTSSFDDTNMTHQCPGLKSTASKHVPHQPNSTLSSGGEMIWSSADQAQLLSAFAYGYILLQPPGGYIAEHLGSKMTLTLTFAMVGLCDLLTPVFARSFGVPAVIFLRVLSGISSGPILATVYAVWTRWAPRYEVSTLMGITFLGYNGGYMCAYAVSGALCDLEFMGGWPLVFYLNGSACLVWVIIWQLMFSNAPAQHPLISSKEKRLFDNEKDIIKSTKRYVRPPVLKVLTSCPLWSLWFSEAVDTFFDYVFRLLIVFYLEKVIGFKISESGAVAVLPYLVNMLVSQASVRIADVVMARGWLSCTNVRKTANFLGQVGPGVSLILLATVGGCNRVVIIVLLVTAKGMNACLFAGLDVNFMDIVPVFAGTLASLGNTALETLGFIAPLIVEAATGFSSDRDRWDLVFIVAGSLMVFGGVQYVFFGQGEELSWARQARIESERENNQMTQQKPV